MPDYVVDYAFKRPSPAAIRAAGYTGVLRYVSKRNDLTAPKIITPAEAQAIRAAGLDLTLNYEWFEDRPLGGYAAGQEDASIADSQADLIGYPRSCAIYYSFDRDFTWVQVVDYIRGVASRSQRPVGIYGGLPIISGAMTAGYARFGWVANAASWSGFRSWASVRAAVVNRPGLHLLQHLHSNTPFHIAGVADTDFDPNTVLQPNYGQWAANQGAFMALSDAQQEQLVTDVAALVHTIKQGEGPSMLHDIEGLIQAIPAQKIDLDALATKIAAKVGAAVGDAVADALAKRLGNG